MEDETAKLKEEVGKLRDEIVKLNHDMEIEWKYTRAERHARQTEIDTITGERDTVFEMVRRFRAAPPSFDFGNLPETTWTPIGLSKLEDAIRRIMSDIRSWSRDFAKDISQFDLQGHDREVFFEEASKIMTLDELGQQEFPKSMRGYRKILCYVLDAMLNHHLFSTIFSDPFFFLGAELSRGLNDILSLGNAWNVEDAQRWRSDTLRLILPEKNGVEESGVKAQTNQLIYKSGIRGAVDFMRSPAKYIINENPGALQELQRTYTFAAEYSYQLWTQRAMFEVSDPSDILGQPYDPQDKGVELHTRIDVRYEKDGEGQPITMVTSPHIKVFGYLPSRIGVDTRWYFAGAYTKVATIWSYLPHPGEPGHGREAVEPRVVPRVGTSPEIAGGRLLKGLDETTLLDLVKPYLDDLAEQLRPLVEEVAPAHSRIQ
ncbi:0f123432-8c9e-4399-b226-28a878e70361 [Sclerotinia trifoliorum]|uniref:0f123432-8c9e-4399-b226-28a878e70361 n=1 Tax=Sclerotinia trifoliorum TaxID=28548 RepID=A0A8H2VT81_9HELO|nr:0f123432-8c9e-4399-b226-28a878e70361 [Sclerotinia trifoliorum]